MGDHFNRSENSIISLTTMSILLIALKKVIILGRSMLRFKKMLMNNSITSTKGVHIGMFLFPPF